MKLHNFLLLFFLLIIVSFNAKSQNSSLAKAKVLIVDKQFSKALDLLNQLPEDKDILLAKGWTYLGLKNYGRASEAFQVVITQNPKDGVAAAGLAACDLYNGKVELAKVGFEKAVKLNKKNVSVYSAIASSCLNAPAPDTALASKYIQTGLSIDYSKDGSLHVLNGDLNLLKKNIGAAVNDYQTALFYEPSNYEAQRKIGVMYTLTKNYRLALEAFTKSINMNGDQLLVYKNLGDLNYNYRRFVDAEKAYKIYMDGAETNNDDIEKYAYTLFFNKKYKESLSFLNQLMAQGGSEKVYLRLKGYMSQGLGDIDTGLSNMEKFFARQDTSKRFLASDYGTYAHLLAAKNRDSLAIVNYESALSIDSTSLEYMEALARLYASNKRKPEAIATFTKMLSNGADSANINYNIGREYYLLGEASRYQYVTLSDSIAKIDSIVKAKPKKINIDPQNISILSQQADSLKSKMTEYFMSSINSLKIVQRLSPSYYTAFLLSGKMYAILDPDCNGNEGLENYQQALSLLEKTDTLKNIKSIKDCLKYIGAYYYTKSDSLQGIDKENMIKQSRSCYERILQIDPNDLMVQEVLKALNTPVEPVKPVKPVKK